MILCENGRSLKDIKKNKAHDLSKTYISTATSYLYNFVPNTARVGAVWFGTAPRKTSLPISITLILRREMSPEML